MKYMKSLYGKTVIDVLDSEELQENQKIELEYYQVKNENSCTPYGIEIVKRDIRSDTMNIENKVLDNICKQKQDTSDLLDILMANKVTPVSVDDVLEDLGKMKAN